MKKKVLSMILAALLAVTGCGNTSVGNGCGADPAGHSFVKEYWPAAPSCRSGGAWNLHCTYCGKNGGYGNDPALPHSPAGRDEIHATYCNETGVMVTECSVCGLELGRESYAGAEHEWLTGKGGPVWSEEAGDFVTYETMYCGRCELQGKRAEGSENKRTEEEGV